MENKVNNNKKVLWIAPRFYNYYESFCEEFKGWENVTIETPFPKNSLIRKMLSSSLLNKTNVTKRILFNYKDRCLERMIKRVRNTQYDVVVIIRANFDYKYLALLKKLQPNAKFVLYEWDSICYYDYTSATKFFDRIVTFDIEDSKKYGFDYLPLFYTNTYKEIADSKTSADIDVFYLGGVRDHRRDSLKKMAACLSEKRLKYCFNVVTNDNPKDYIGMNVFRKPLTIDQFKDDYIRSKAILEISWPNQNGLSIRVVEAVGARKKIIIDTNLIKHEPFYSTNNVFILGEDSLDNLDGFLNSDSDYSTEVNNYSIRSFAKALIN